MAMGGAATAHLDIEGSEDMKVDGGKTAEHVG